ncbi:MAG: CopG family transcriptional regulator [Nitrospirae bacterium]|nr:CopG family transcriptional regulator [Nitrospirota bacterium]
MQAQLTVRLSEDLDKGISTLARKLHLKRSDIVRIALERFLGESNVEEGRPYDKVKGLIGSVGSGVSDLGEAHRRHLLTKFKKHA